MFAGWEISKLKLIYKSMLSLYKVLSIKFICWGNMSKVSKNSNGELVVPDIVTIPFIEGDGVGSEITDICKKVIDAAVSKVYSDKRRIEWLEIYAGEKGNTVKGSYLPDETLTVLKEYLIGVKGPLTTAVGGGMRSLNVALRQELDLYSCVRPVKWYEGVASPLKEPHKVDMTIFRENTEDIYAGIEWNEGTAEAKKFYNFIKNVMGVTTVRFPETSSFGVKPVSVEGSSRLMRSAITYAINKKLPKVTIVHKGNIMKFTEGGFLRWGYEVAEKEFSNETFTINNYNKISKAEGVEVADKALQEARDKGKIIIDDCIADAFLQNSLLKPENYSVIATLNLNGDYISDQLAAMVGGIGIAPGANINYNTGHAIFEATHGTAPDIAGKNIANPLSLLLSLDMMMEYIGWIEVSDIIKISIEEAFANRCSTNDLARFMENGQALSTSDFGNYLIKIIKGWGN